MKRRNLSWGCLRIAQQIALAFHMVGFFVDPPHILYLAKSSKPCFATENNDSFPKPL